MSGNSEVNKNKESKEIRGSFANGESKMYKRDGNKPILKIFGRQRKLIGKKIVSIAMCIAMLFR